MKTTVGFIQAASWQWWVHLNREGKVVDVCMKLPTDWLVDDEASCGDLRTQGEGHFEEVYCLRLCSLKAEPEVEFLFK